jgi:hypothetical protein
MIVRDFFINTMDPIRGFKLIMNGHKLYLNGLDILWTEIFL